MNEFQDGNVLVVEEETGYDPLLGPYVLPKVKGHRSSNEAGDALEAEAARESHRGATATRSVSKKTTTSGNLMFLTAKDISTRTPERPEWIWEPYVIKGGITEITGKIKSAGKTTLVTYACRKVLEGRSFLGFPTAKTGVMYLTEQPEGSFREALRRADLLDREDFVVLSWHRTYGLGWSDVVASAVEEAKVRNLGLLVVDTLPRFAGLKGDSENNSGDALEAMEPLQMAAGQGLGVVIVRHERKSGGDVTDAGRGSSAFGAEADVILSIKRPEGNVRNTIREIHALGRFDETPETLAVELTDKGYKVLGSSAAVAEEEAMDAIWRILPVTPDEAMTEKNILAETEKDGVKRTVAKDAIKEMLDSKNIGRMGRGVKGDAYRYWRVTNSLSRTDSKHSDWDEGFRDTSLGGEYAGQKSDSDENPIEDLDWADDLVEELEEDTSQSAISNRMSVLVQCLDEIFEENPHLEVDPRIFEEHPNRRRFSEISSLWSWYVPRSFHKRKYQALLKSGEGSKPDMDEIKKAIQIRSDKVKEKRV